MNGTGLTVANVTTLASKELTVELFNIMNAINEGNKSAWEVARAYKRIIDDELFDEDFEKRAGICTLCRRIKVYN